MIFWMFIQDLFFFCRGGFPCSIQMHRIPFFERYGLKAWLYGLRFSEWRATTSVCALMQIRVLCSQDHHSLGPFKKGCRDIVRSTGTGEGPWVEGNRHCFLAYR